MLECLERLRNQHAALYDRASSLTETPRCRASFSEDVPNLANVMHRAMSDSIALQQRCDVSPLPWLSRGWIRKLFRRQARLRGCVLLAALAISSASYAQDPREEISSEQFTRGFAGLFQRQVDFRASATSSLSLLDLDGDFQNFREDRGLAEQGISGAVETFILHNATSDGYYADLRVGASASRRDGYVNVAVGRRGRFAIRSAYAQFRKYYDDSRGEAFHEFPATSELDSTLFTTRRIFNIEAEVRLPDGPHLKGSYERRTERGELMLLKGSPVGGLNELRLFPTPMQQDTVAQEWRLEGDYRAGVVNLSWQGSYEQIDHAEGFQEQNFGATALDATVQVDDTYATDVYATSLAATGHLRKNLFVALSSSYIAAQAKSVARRRFTNVRLIDFLRDLSNADASRRRLGHTLGIVYSPIHRVTIRGSALIATQHEDAFGVEVEREGEPPDPNSPSRRIAGETERERFTHAESLEATIDVTRRLSIRSGIEFERSDEDFELLLKLVDPGIVAGQRFEAITQERRRVYVKATYRPLRRLKIIGGYSRRWREVDKAFPDTFNFLQFDDFERRRDELSFGIELRLREALTITSEYRRVERHNEIQPLDDSQTLSRTHHATLSFNSALHPKLFAYGLVDLLVDNAEIKGPLPADIADFEPVEYDQSAITYMLGLQLVPNESWSSTISWTETIARNDDSNN